MARKPHNLKWTETAIREAYLAAASRIVAAGFDFEVICSAKVTGKASRIESRLLALGVSPRYCGFNGASEFRALSPSALTTAVEIVASMLDNSN